jgi:hypothetical protein
VHWLDGLAVDSSPEAGVWVEWPVEEVWRRYFEALGELAAGGHVDVELAAGSFGATVDEVRP